MTIKQLKATIEQADALKQISVSYTEISSNRLKKIRILVEKNRGFLDELAAVYIIVKQIAKERNALSPKNPKTVSILITSNYHFYGNVNQNVTSYFVDTMHAHATDQIVVGKTAVEWLQGIHYNLSYTFIPLKHDYPTSEELDMLVSKIKGYTKILVFYSRMRTVMSQIPTYQDITQTSYLQTQPPQTQRKRLFVFEPELTKILDFFETQGLNLLLQQAFLESELSRTASRLVSMDQAQTNADKFINEHAMLLNQAKKSAANTKLIETYTSILLGEKAKDNIYGY